jgi:hypothetical protein
MVYGWMYPCMCMHVLSAGNFVGIGVVCFYSFFGVILNRREGPLLVSGDCKRGIGA